MPTSSRLAVLREPNYRRLFFGRTTSLIGDGLAPVAIAFAVLDLTGSATDLGLVMAAHSLAIPAHTAVIAAGALVSGLTVGLAEVFYETVAAQHIPQESLSRVMAYDWFGSLALEPLGLALIGPLAAGIGTSTTLWVTAGVVFSCQLAVILVPSVRRLESRPNTTGPPLPLRPVEASD